jgi:hypothetical protein
VPPNKEGNANKIDAVVATIMALGVSLSTEPPSDVFAQFISF